MKFFYCAVAGIIILFTSWRCSISAAAASGIPFDWYVERSASSEDCTQLSVLEFNAFKISSSDFDVASAEEFVGYSAYFCSNRV